MIHDYDTHYWLGKTAQGWVSMADWKSSDQIFQDVELLRLEPLYDTNYQTIFEVARPAGYTLFFRGRVFFDTYPNNIIGVAYLVGAEAGSWTPWEAGGFPMDPDAWLIWGLFADPQDYLPVQDGFRAILGPDGSIDFYNSDNWSYKLSSEGGKDLYKFVRIA